MVASNDVDSANFHSLKMPDLDHNSQATIL